MNSVNKPNVQSVLRIVELYIEEEIKGLEKKLENVKKINTQLISEDMCLEVEILNEEDEKEVIKSLMELINFK